MGNAIYFKYLLLYYLRLMERHWVIREVYGPQMGNLIVLMNPEFYIIKRYLNLR
jgi:hypothetical protein